MDRFPVAEGGDSVFDKGVVDTFGGQVVLSARYTSRGWWWGMGLTVLACVTFCGVYVLIMRGRYVQGISGVLGATLVLMAALDSLFTKQIVFCQDRVVKIWHFLGQRTIYYSKAKVSGSPRNWGVQRSKWYQITEMKDDGRRLLFQIPIVYGTQFVPPDAARRIDMIVDYLTGNNENRTRKCTESYLPREVTCQTSPVERFSKS